MLCSEKSLTIQVGNEFIVCPQQGGPIKLEAGPNTNYSGILICPDYNSVCTSEIWCNDPLDCIDKGVMADESSYQYTYPLPSNFPFFTSRVPSL